LELLATVNCGTRSDTSLASSSVLTFDVSAGNGPRLADDVPDGSLNHVGKKILGQSDLLSLATAGTN